MRILKPRDFELVGASAALMNEELVAAVKGGDSSACEEFVRRHAGRMLSVARRMLRCEQDAEDAVQDAFASAFRSLDSFEGNAEIGTWLHRIVVNACLMKLRAARSRPAVSIDPLLPAFDETGHHAGRVTEWAAPCEQLEAAETRARVRECIDRLPEPYRIVIVLRDIEELDTAETAGRLEISEAAVKVRLHRARQALRTLLNPFLSVGA